MTTSTYFIRNAINRLKYVQGTTDERLYDGDLLLVGGGSMSTGDPITAIKVGVGSGCGSVGRAVASDTRGPRFESSHRQNLFVTSTVLKRRK